MIGLSCYILADTYFVSARLGSNGLTALNLALPCFNFINGIGLMLGIGGATRYTIFRGQDQKEKADTAFSQAFFWGAIIGALFLAVGQLFAHPIAVMLGAEGYIEQMSAVYLKTIFSFAPFFILNNVMIIFVRNDYSPRLAMFGMLGGSFLNIVLDYLFVFPLDMGILGAALATGFSPVFGILLMFTHMMRGKNHFHFRRCLPSVRRLIAVCSLGTSALIDEASGGIVLIVFNLLMLKFAGNTGVAAYGIIANLALVALAVFIGLSQGSQPLFSRFYGEQRMQDVRYVYRLGMLAALIIGAVIVAIIFLFTESLISIFNSEGDRVLADIAFQGMRLYFLGFLIAGMNILTAAFFAATENPKATLAASAFRGIIGIISAAVILSVLMGQTGLWLAFPVTETAAFILCTFLRMRIFREKGLGPEKNGI